MFRFLGLAVLLLSILICQAAAAQQPAMNVQLTLKLIEFRPTAAMQQTTASATKIVGIFRQLEELDELDVIQVVQITSVENTEGQFQRETPPKGITDGEGKKLPVCSTQAQYRFALKDERIMVDIDFSSIRYRVHEAKVANRYVTTVQSTLLMDLGKPVFLGGGGSGEDASFVIAVLDE